jgi:hypothetical protein
MVMQSTVQACVARSCNLFVSTTFGTSAVSRQETAHQLPEPRDHHHQERLEISGMEKGVHLNLKDKK